MATVVSRRISGALAAGLSLYGLYWVVAIVDAQFYRTSFLLVALVLTFIDVGRGRREAESDGADASHVPRPASRIDWLLAALAIIALGWPLVDHAAFPYRRTPLARGVTDDE